MFRNALSEVYGSGLLGLAPDSTADSYYSLREIRASLRALPLTGEEAVPTTAASPYRHQAEQLLHGVDQPAQLLDLTLPCGFPAYSFYDGVLKSQMLGTVNHRDPHLSLYLGLTLQYLDYYDRLFDRRSIRAVVVSHPVHFRYATLVWLALQRGVPVFVMNYVNESITIRKLSSPEDFNLPVEHPTVAQRDALAPETRRRLVAAGEAYLGLMRRGEVGQIAMVNGYRGDQDEFRDRARLCKLMGTVEGRPNIVLFGNCWPDFPHQYGRSYFTDFQHWFELTLDVIRDIRTCNWILKPHPAEHLYGKAVSMRQIAHGRVAQGISFWPDGASGNALEVFADGIVTCLGSAGIEYTASGNMVLAASRTPYQPWAFCHHGGTLHGYAQALRTITRLTPPDARQQEDAKLFAALTYTSPAETRGTRGEYTYPWGGLSYRLWPGVPVFVRRNQDSIVYEIRMMRRWLDSDTHSYNVFKHLNVHLWGR